VGDIANGTGAQVRAAINTEFNTIRKDASAATAATAGWYRIAASALNIGRNRAFIELDWTGTGIRGSAEFVACCHEGAAASVKLQELAYSVYDAAHPGLTKARIVYHTTPTGNYAYVEVYLAEATATTISVRLGNPVGWSAVAPSTAGSIPGGYSNLEYTFLGSIGAPPASAGFHYLAGDAPYSGTVLSHTSIPANAWKTVGPTGSGADVIWTALDALPNGVRAVRLNLSASAAGNVDDYVICYLRKRGSSVVPREAIFAKCAVSGHGNNSYNTVTVAVNTSKLFEVKWITLAVSGYALDMFLEEWCI
jgi:hypothetical protein